MTPLDYAFLRQTIKARCGLVMSADDQELVESRLLPVARKAGFNRLGELVVALKNARNSALMTAVVEALITSDTFFFRDKTAFNYIRATIVPTLLAARKQSRTIRIWCAAASTGQEAYSLALCLRDLEESLAGCTVEILATDLSNRLLDRARRGLYTHFEVQRGLPIKLLIKHFTQSGEQWQIAPELRAMVTWRQLNLLSDFSSLGTFDVIFCRNALTHFDRETKSDVLDRLAHVTARDGYLVLGATEMIVGLTDRFRAVAEQPGLYAPNPICARLPWRASANSGLRLVAVNCSR
ncbi:MAG TPA: protein-glutamate O-methyltransferase CheR [Xanthobacteraceae bacterium]